MKTRLLPLIILFVGAFLATWQGVAAQEAIILTPFDINWEADEIFAGDRLAVTVDFRNAGSEAAPAGTPVDVTLLAADSSLCEDADDDPALVTVEKNVTLAGPLAPGETASTGAIEIVVPGEGDYYLTARLSSAEATIGGGCDDIIVHVTSALPPSIAQLLAGLGTFAAVMAIMALGTEVTIDSLKFFIGLKQKVTAMEAFDKLEAELPGRLATLGVTADKRTAVRATLNEVRQTLQPVESARQVYAQVQKGDFSGAYAGLVALAPAVGTATEEELTRLKNNARTGVRNGFSQLCARLNLPPELKDDVESYCLDLIDDVTVDSATTLLEDIFKAIQARAPKLTTAWLEEQIDGALGGGRAEILRLVDNDVLPVLDGLGFASGTARQMVEGWLDQAEQVASEEVDEYISSLQKLLTGVEMRRNEMQSPLRKIYRRLRESELAALGALAGVIGGYLALFVAGAVVEGGAEGRTFVDFIWQLLLAVITAVVSGAIVQRAIRQSEPEPPPAPLPLPDGVTLEAWEMQWRQEHRHTWQRSLGYVLRTFEYAYNKILGRDEQPRERYGEVSEEILALIDSITATSAAEILLRREDHHRDEEASRLRVLRVIAIIVGFFLAYLIQIDAVLLLAEAVPGILGINQIINISAETLNAAFPWFELPPNNRVTTGIILTGLAASAGSAFWHDFLGRLQGTKEATEATAKLLRRARDLPNEIN